MASFTGTSGNDTFMGTAGVADQVSFPTATSGMKVDLTIASAQDTGQGLDTFISIEQLTGTSFNDVFTGDGANNLFYGRSGADSLTGGGGADEMYGEGGNDTLYGGDGNDILNGGDNDDWIYGEAGDDSIQVYGAVGEDHVDGGTGTDSIFLYFASQGLSFSLANTARQQLAPGLWITAQNLEWVYGSDYGDALTGDAGNNLISGMDGNDTIDGGAGTDTVAYRGNSADFSIVQSGDGYKITDIRGGTVNWSDGADTVKNVEFATFYDKTVSLPVVTAPPPVVNQTITGTSGADTLTGGDGDDSIVGGAGADTIDGGAGNDWINSYSESANLTDADRDVLKGGAGDDQILAGVGDAVDGGPGTDTLYLYLYGETSGTSVNTGGFRDGSATVAGATITGIETVAVVQGGDYNDTLIMNSSQASRPLFHGGGGNDSIWSLMGPVNAMGGEGDDMLLSYGAGDSFDGGPGFDTVNLGVRNVAVTLNLATHSGALADIQNVEAVIGGGLADNFTGDAADNVFTGYGGNDVIDGGAGADTAVYTGAYAGYSFAQNSDGGITVTDNRTGPTVAPEGADRLIRIETLKFADKSVAVADLFPPAPPPNPNVINGTSGNDILTGTSAAETINGLGGNDTLVGGSGADKLDGGDDYDYLYSSGPLGTFSRSYYYRDATIFPSLDTGSEIDTLVGGAADDTLSAGYGDFVDGGAGSDALFLSLKVAPSGVTADFRQASVTMGGGTITGVELISWLEGSNFADDITFGDGNGNAINTAAFGMGGNDRLVAGYMTGWLYGGDGDDVLDGRRSQYLHFIDGGPGNDTIYGNDSGAAFYYGGDGNDTIYSKSEAHGGAGNDLIVSQALSFGGWQYGEDGDDELRASSVASYLAGGAGADTLTGGAGADRLFSFELGNAIPADDVGREHDVITGAGGDDIIGAGYGDDVDGGGGTDTLYLSLGGAPNGVTFDAGAIAGGKSLSLGGGTITGVETLAYLRGSDFDDTLAIAPHTNPMTVDGGAGRDTIDYSAYAQGVILHLANEVGPGSDVLKNVESVVGTKFADSLTGSGSDNSLWGGAGDDTIDGGAGNDTVYYNGASTDFSYGTTSDGYFTVKDLRTGAANEGTDKLRSIETVKFTDIVVLPTGSQPTTPAGPSNIITGTAYNDRLIGTAGGDNISGLGFHDTISGAGGADLIDGGDGNDMVYSGAISPEFVFPAGHLNWAYTAPLLDTGTEVDTLIGGAGDDQIFAGYGDNVDGGADTTFGDSLYISFAGAPQGVTVDFSKAIVTIGDGTIRNIENINWVQGSPFGDEVRLSTDTYRSNFWTVVEGLGGNDKLYGGAGTLALYGGEGDDLLDGRADGTMLDGGPGNDIIYTNPDGYTTAFGGEGDDTITTNGEAHGGAGNDLIILQLGRWSGASDRWVFGDAGNDEIRASIGGTRMVGGDGADVLKGNSWNDILFSANANVAALDWTPQDDMGREHDVLTGGDGGDVLAGGYGDDIDGGAGTDTLYLSLGGATSGITLDTAAFAGGKSYSLGGGTITGVETLVSLRGSEFDDALTIAAHTSAMTIDGGAGKDTLVYAGASTDFSWAAPATAGASVALKDLRAGGVTDTLRNVEFIQFSDKTVSLAPPPPGPTTFTGTSGSDFLNGTSGPDIIRALGGNDYLYNSAGDDVFDGGDGYDVFNFAYAAAGVRVDFSLTSPQNTNDGLDSFTGIEAAFASKYNDTIKGGPGVDYISGRDGDDLLTGTDAHDQLQGDEGNDTLNGGGGDDYLGGGAGKNFVYGEAGNDSITITPNSDDFIDGGAGLDAVQFGFNTTGLTVNLANTGRQEIATGFFITLQNVENLYGGEYGDRLTGDSGDNVIGGFDGADTIDGGAGTDTVYMRGASTDFSIVQTSDGWTITDKRAPGVVSWSDGTDTVKNVEFVWFSDKTVALTSTSNPANPSTPSNPTNPGTPAQPTIPTGPAPTNPTAPSAPVDPTPPSNPSIPTDPTSPSNPSTPAMPTPAEIPQAVNNILRGGSGDDLSARVAANTITPTEAVAELVAKAGATTSVATLAYQFFTGAIPSAAGIDYLVSPTGPNPNNLNSAYYQSFNLENRYINFAVNLGKNGEGQAKFGAEYGGLSLSDAARKAYATIFGTAPTDEKTHALIDGRVDYFAYYGLDGANGMGTKAAMVGWLLAEAKKADIGTYAKADDAFLMDLMDGANFAVDLVGTYAKPEYALS